MNKPQPIQTPAILRRNLRRYLKGQSSPQVLNAVSQAEKAGIDINEFALRGRDHSPYPQGATSSKGRDRSISPPSLLVDPSPGGRARTAGCVDHNRGPRWRARTSPTPSDCPSQAGIYDLIAPTIKDADEARLIAYREPTTGGFSPTFRPPRTWGDSTTYGRGGLPARHLHTWLPDSFLDDHVEVEGDPAFGVHLAWQSFWTRDSLERKKPVEEPKVEKPAASILSIFD